MPAANVVTAERLHRCARSELGRRFEPSWRVPAARPSPSARAVDGTRTRNARSSAASTAARSTPCCSPGASACSSSRPPATCSAHPTSRSRHPSGWSAEPSCTASGCRTRASSSSCSRSVCVAAIWFYLARTRQGRRMQAVMQNRELAACSGIATSRVDQRTFFTGSGLAGVAGVALTLIGPGGPGPRHLLHRRRVPRRRGRRPRPTPRRGHRRLRPRPPPQQLRRGTGPTPPSPRWWSSP
ncbi:ABC transporter permease subunit [Yinghuangia aomiensis]